MMRFIKRATASLLERLIPSKAAIIATLAAFAAGFLAWLRRDAKRDAQTEIKQKDYEHAEDIERRVTDSRTDPERLRPYEGRGYRD